MKAAATNTRRPPAAPGKPARPAAAPRLSAARRERRLLAQALHDTFYQELTGISLLAHGAARQCQTRCPEMADKFKEIAGLLQNSYAGLQELLRCLREDK